MEEQAVFWTDSAVPQAVYGGGMVVTEGELRLRGSDGHRHVVEQVDGAALAAVVADDEEAGIAGFPSVRLDLRDGRSLVVAAALGVVALAELVDAVLSFFPMP